MTDERCHAARVLAANDVAVALHFRVADAVHLQVFSEEPCRGLLNIVGVTQSAKRVSEFEQERVPIFTTLDGARAACTGIEHATELRAYMMQDLHAGLARGAPAPVGS